MDTVATNQRKLAVPARRIGVVDNTTTVSDTEREASRLQLAISAAQIKSTIAETGVNLYKSRAYNPALARAVTERYVALARATEKLDRLAQVILYGSGEAAQLN